MNVAFDKRNFSEVRRALDVMCQGSSKASGAL
jgi:hypothetical protein